MLFRTIFPYLGPSLPSTTDIEAAASSAPACDPGALEPFRLGFASPWGAGDERLVLEIGQYLLLRVIRAERVLPAAVLAAAVDELAGDFRRSHGREPGRSLRRRWRIEKLAELLPRAFVRRRGTWILFDRRGGWIAVGTSSRPRAEEALALLRSALGGLPAKPVRPRLDPADRFTAWVSGSPLPSGFTIGETALLRGEEGGKVRLQGIAPSGNAVRALLGEGFRVVRLELTFREQVSVELGEDLALRRMRMIDELPPEAGDELAARFALEAGAISALLQALGGLFAIAEAGENESAIPTPLSLR